MTKTTPFIEAMEKHILLKDKTTKFKINSKRYDSLLSLLLHYVSHHKKVFICRFDLHYPLKMWNDKRDEMISLSQDMGKKIFVSRRKT